MYIRLFTYYYLSNHYCWRWYVASLRHTMVGSRSHAARWPDSSNSCCCAFKLCLFVPQFQLVADLFQDEKGVAVSSAKTSKINVRPAKPMPKSHNREHRKTVGTQVRLREVTPGFIKISWEVKRLACLSLYYIYISLLSSFGAHYIFWWRLWMLQLRTTSAA